MNKTTNKTTNKRDVASELLLLLENNPNLSMVEIGQKLQITPFNVQYYINKLKDAERIKRVGSKKTGRWVVK